jgi:hypothetical protein
VLASKKESVATRRHTIETTLMPFVAPNKVLFPELDKRNLPRSYLPVW